MKTITLITGARGSGKTTKAKEIIGRSEFIYIHDASFNSPWTFRELKETTKFILIDEISYSNFKKMSEMFRRNKIKVTRQSEPIRVLECPSVVCVLRNEQ